MAVVIRHLPMLASQSVNSIAIDFCSIELYTLGSLPLWQPEGRQLSLIRSHLRSLRPAAQERYQQARDFLSQIVHHHNCRCICGCPVLRHVNFGPICVNLRLPSALCACESAPPPLLLKTWPSCWTRSWPCTWGRRRGAPLPLCLLRIRCRRTASAICVSRATSVCSKLSTTQGQCRIWEADQLQSPRTRQRMPSAVLTSLGNETERGVHLCHCQW